jgi:hypothetical protein
MTSVVQVYYAQTSEADAEWYADIFEVLDGLHADDVPAICFHTGRRHDVALPWTNRRPINRAIEGAITRAKTLCRNRALRSLDGFVIGLALFVLTTWPPVPHLVIAEAVTLARVVLVAQALLCAVGAGRALEAWRFLREATWQRAWLSWPHYTTFRVGAPLLARAGTPAARAAGRGLVIALLLVAMSTVVVVPSQHVAVLGDGQLCHAPVSLYAGQWELYQIEWEGKFVVPLVGEGEKAVWVYIVSYSATAGPGAVPGDWVEWTEGTAAHLVTRVLNEMYQQRDPGLPDEAWKAMAAGAFGETEMMAAFADAIAERIREAYGEIELEQLEVRCEKWTVAQYIEEVQ